MSAQSTEIRVLVADDEEDILELLGEYLRARGYAVHTAADGIDAIDVVRSGVVDVVLTDLKMPTVGGLELLAEIRRLPLPPATIVMTGFGTVETALRAMKDGASDYILKPFKLKEVHETIVRAAERLKSDRQVVQDRNLLAFYEVALSTNAKQDLSRLYGMVASVALRDLRADEVAVWTSGPTGWDAVSRAGAIGALAALDPSEIVDERLEAGVLAVPIHSSRGRVGVLAVAGGAPRADRDLQRPDTSLGWWRSDGLRNAPRRELNLLPAARAADVGRASLQTGTERIRRGLPPLPAMHPHSQSIRSIILPLGHCVSSLYQSAQCFGWP
jgi:CheY-like chemotaxis protein